MNQPDRILRVGIIGTGWVAGARHFPSYRREREAEVVVVCDQHLSKAEAFARKRGIPVATDSLADFLARDLDLVSVCTPPFAHCDTAIAALNAGCNVFLEKPMAMTSNEAEAIARAAQDSGKLLCVSHNFLYSHAMQRLRQVLDSGEAGPIQFVIGLQASSPRRRLPAWYGILPGGLFFDESPHFLYLLGNLLGDLQLTSATAVANTPGAQQPMRSLHAVFASDRAPATLTMTFEAPVSEWHLIVVCERRILMADLFRDFTVVLGPDDSHRAANIFKTSLSVGIQHTAGFLKSGLHLMRGRMSWGHEPLIAAAIEAVRSGKPSPIRVDDALRVVKITEAILQDSIGERENIVREGRDADGQDGAAHRVV